MGRGMMGKRRRGEEIRRTAKKPLAWVLRWEDLQIKNVMDETYVGNRLGLDLAGLWTKLAAVEEIVTSQQEELNGLPEEVISLRISSEGYQLHEQAVKVLNAHADTILSNPKFVTEKLPALLKKIVELLERFGGDEGCSDELVDACHSFWHDGEHGSIEED
ncbi:hypothetical protein HOY82DRAFT_622059 [Tuber indicum]|nr:hypothetical protein HOY82DRAFT_622059 [Tuber indicum]